MAKSTETEERNRDVARLRAIGLYTNKRIAQALRIDESTVSHIYHERSRVPNNPVMSLAEVALMEDVNIEVVRSLVAEHHLKTVYRSYGFGRDIHGGLVVTAIRINDARGTGKEWVSVIDAAEIAGMERPRGMYNRVLKGQVVSMKACGGRAFHIGDQKGLTLIVKKDSIEPAKGKSKQEEPWDPEHLLKEQFYPTRAEFSMVVKSDMSEEPIIIPGRQLDVTITLGNVEGRPVQQVLKLDVDILSGDRAQVRTRTYFP